MNVTLDVSEEELVETHGRRVGDRGSQSDHGDQVCTRPARLFSQDGERHR